jgi:phosphate transport system substrate-binding protein
MKKLFLFLSALTLTFGVAACESTETIKVYTRDTSSGTRAGFMEVIGFEDGATDDSLLVEGFIIAGNDEIINAIQTDPFAIGYVSLSTLDTSLFKGFNFEGVEPTETTVLSGEYGLSRRFNYMLRDDYSVYGADAAAYEGLAKAFVAYMGSREGQLTIKEAGGIISVNGPAWSSIVGQHPICSQDNSSLTLKFGGSDSVESIAKDLSPDFSSVCGNVVPEHNHTGSSNAYKGLNGDNSSIDDGLSIHVGFASREFKDSESAVIKGVVAVDAIVAVGSLDNEVDNLTAAQLAAIYSGEITDWNELK